MWNYVGIVRSGKRLMQAKTRIENMQDRTKEYCRDFLLTRDLPEPRNIAPAAELIIAWYQLTNPGQKGFSDATAGRARLFVTYQ